MADTTTEIVVITAGTIYEVTGNDITQVFHS